MAGSHEVRGSIPLGSTKLSSPVYPGFFVRVSKAVRPRGSNPARVQQSSGLLHKEGEARRTKTCTKCMDSRSP